MTYSRRNVVDGVTVMNKELYDNVQDGIDELKDSLKEVKEIVENVNLRSSVLDATVEPKQQQSE